jgi:methyltransferase (TIGR00027 family)
MANGPVSTFEGAAARRAAHARYERPPVFDDTWALKLLSARTRWVVRIPALYRRFRVPGQARSDGFFALALASFRLTDDLVAAAVARGVRQYLILSAGMDSFGLRRTDLRPPLRVFELDHPAPQAIKRRRIERAVGSWPADLELVPIDFETTTIEDALAASSFDSDQPAVASWLNSIAYLSEAATTASLQGLARVLAPGSQLIFNYPPAVKLTDEQKAAMKALRTSVASRGEPFRDVYEPARMVAIVEDCGFVVEEHLTEADLAARFYTGRTVGPYPTMPGRVLIVRRGDRAGSGGQHEEDQ